MMSSPKHSPWGKVDQCVQYAEGVYRVFTSSHGGLALTKDASAGISGAILSKAVRTREWNFFEEDSAIGLVFEARPDLYRAVLDDAGEGRSDDELLKQVRVSNRSWYPELFGLPANCKHCSRQHPPVPAEMLIGFTAYGSWHKDVPAGFVGVAAAADLRSERQYFLVPAEEYAERDAGCFLVDPSRYQSVAELR